MPDIFKNLNNLYEINMRYNNITFVELPINKFKKNLTINFMHSYSKNILYTNKILFGNSLINMSKIKKPYNCKLIIQ